ncbi:hypothetical protein AQ490_15130 [Wenjunlia vitaminophila]|uniref:Uncharacterized protein n=1 Tax=Wenjunlia vitaminophila TaxID=76728 RepID=A0A0T6LWI5_WENVI|nr:DUF5995 family protein [Wenjunlia vitaminophila]KRV50422.1 hypothetical protein AQ490_15130 [Wenjunlia vitaminophila]
MTSLEQVQVRSVDAVVARMRELRRSLPPGDGVGYFNAVYLSVTEEVARRLRSKYFTDPVVAAELDVRFARRYLHAVEADLQGSRISACWRPLFQVRGHPRIHALQFALAGINAHIGHDLALAVSDTCRSRGLPPGELEDDFRRVGEVLTELEERVREELMPGPDLLDVADPLTHLVDSWSLERARDAAWATACVLWRLRDLPDFAEEFTQRLDKSIGLVSRFLLTPVRGGQPAR